MGEVSYGPRFVRPVWRFLIGAYRGVIAEVDTEPVDYSRLDALFDAADPGQDEEHFYEMQRRLGLAYTRRQVALYYASPACSLARQRHLRAPFAVYELWSVFMEQVDGVADDPLLLEALLKCDALFDKDRDLRDAMEFIRHKEQETEVDYARLHRLWLRTPCDARQLWRRQRAAQLRFRKWQVDAYTAGRMLVDSNDRILRRILAV